MEYIKFKCNWEARSISEEINLEEINNWTAYLKRELLIGVDDEGVGYGNVSIRQENKTFLITGTQTAKVPELDLEHYAMIEKYDFIANSVDCYGLTKASAESLTHAIVYESVETVNAVVHVHSNHLWEKFIDKKPTTKDVPYGTPEMAFAIQKLIKEQEMTSGLIIMAGHQDGILAFGSTLKEAVLNILALV